MTKISKESNNIKKLLLANHSSYKSMVSSAKGRWEESLGGWPTIKGGCEREVQTTKKDDGFREQHA